MRALAVDIGNSRLKAALLEDGSVLQDYREEDPAGQPLGAAERMAKLYSWCAQRLRADGPISGVAVTSVVPRLVELWTHLWSSGASRGVRQLVIDASTWFPFELDVESAHTVGADRYCNVAGAVSRHLDHAIVVDLGTANTYDVLEGGTFRGGLIAPGLTRSHDALVEGGAQLPPLPLSVPGVLLGRDTETAILAGSYHQGAGGVVHVLGRLLATYPQSTILITGGLSALVAPQMLEAGLVFERCPHLTLEGAAFLLQSSLPSAWERGAAD